MNIKTKEANGVLIATVYEDSVLLLDEQSTLDFIMTVNYETGSNRIAINKEAITEDFFKLSTGVAGKILQKIINYNFKLAVIGDFSGYTSKPLKDFIYECNNGNSIFFVSSEQEAVGKLSAAGRPYL